MQTPDLVSVAYHEAGHAVMAALSPYHEVGDTVIASEDRKLTKSNGCSSYARLKPNKPWEFRIVVGGGAGERILTPDLDPFGIESLMCGSPSAAHWDLIASGFVMGHDDDPEEFCRKQDRRISAACKLLKQHELAVHKVAKILRTTGRISGDDVRAIVGKVRKVANA